MPTKDLKVKDMSKTLKRGTVIKNIRLTSNDEQIECRIGKTTLVLKTCFFKKALPTPLFLAKLRQYGRIVITVQAI